MWSAVTAHAAGFAVARYRPASGVWAVAGRRAQRAGGSTAYEGWEIALASAGGPGVGPQAHALWNVRHPWGQRLAFEAGTGLGWAFAPYDPILRPGNFILGSHLNAALRLGLTAQLTPRLRLGATLTHLSNGSFAQPNLGTNLVALRTSFALSTPTSPPTSPSPSTSPSTTPSHRFSALLGGREAGLPDSRRHPIAGCAATVTGPIRGRAVRWAAGASLVCNSSLRLTHRDGPTEDVRDWLQPALALGAEWRYDRLRFTVLTGAVLANTDYIMGSRMLDTELGYTVGNGFEVTARLRAFGFRADFPAVGCAWTPGRYSGQESPKAPRKTSRSEVPTTPLPSRSSGHTGGGGV